jgi:7-carboxy-7-deazaguanine synthase
MSNNQANIIEIFSSIQGEGTYVGYRQIFIRFSGCNLNCEYCDTDFSPVDICKLYVNSLNHIPVKNPLGVDDLIEILQNYDLEKHHSISLTGGEPLLNTDFLFDFFKKIKKYTGIKFFLETNGTLAKELEQIIDYLDIISMDYKLESLTHVPASDHREFAKTALKSNKELIIKAVISSQTTDDEIYNLRNFILKLDCNLPLILQPLTTNNENEAVSTERILYIHELMAKQLNNVRIIPQTHRIAGFL